MYTKEQLKSLLAQQLYEFYFNNIYGFVNSQFRTNIHLEQLANYPVINVYSDINTYIKLPNTPTEFIYLFKFNNKDYQGLYKQLTSYPWPHTWINLEDLCLNFGINIELYTENGYMLPKRMCQLSSVFVPGNYVSYITVSQQISNYIDIRNKKIYMTSYYDTSEDNDRIVSSYIPSYDQSEANVILTGLINRYNSAEPDKRIIYINGYYYSNPDIEIMNITNLQNKVVECIIDNNIDFSFTQEERYKYFSDIDSQFKDIIHVPSEVNGRNINDNLYTINLFHIYCVDKDTGKGLKVPFTIQNETYQITHRDLGIPELSINSITSLLEREDVKFDIKIMKYNNVNKSIIHSRQWFELLYRYVSDERIIELLKGDDPDYVGYFDAATLEQSDFLKLLFKYHLDTDPMEFLPELVRGIGYYNLPEILCSPKHQINITADMAGTLNFIELPNTGTVIEPNTDNEFIADVFFNKIKLPYDNFSYGSTTTKLKITPSLPLTINENDVIDLIIYAGTRSAPLVLNPTELEHSYTFADYGIQEQDQIDLYIRIESSGLRDHNNEEIPHVWTKLDEIEKNQSVSTLYDETTKTSTFIFPQNSYDKTFYIVPKIHNYVKNQTFTIDVGDTLTTVAPSIFITGDIYAQNANGNESELIPFLSSENFDIYLNGYKLIEGIDYQKVTISDSGNIGKHVFTIQNKDYLNIPGNNLVEIHASSKKVYDRVSGFIVDDVFNSTNDVSNLWLFNSSKLTVGGKLVDNTEVNYTYQNQFTINFPVPNITSFSLETSMPQSIEWLFKDMITSDYFTTTTKLLQLLIEENPPTIINPELVLIERYKTIYSSYLNDIILQILEGNFNNHPYSYNWSELENILAPYDYMKSFDIIFTSGFFKDIPENFKFSNVFPNFIEVHEGINFNPRHRYEELNPTKIILIKSIIDHIFENLQ